MPRSYEERLDDYFEYKLDKMKEGYFEKIEEEKDVDELEEINID